MADRNKENNPNEEMNQQNPGKQPQEEIRGQQRTPQRDTLSDEPIDTENQPAKKGHQSGR
jgi:hypothetical protein